MNKDENWVPVLLSNSIALVPRKMDVTSEEGFMKFLYQISDHHLVHA